MHVTQLAVEGYPKVNELLAEHLLLRRECTRGGYGFLTASLQAMQKKIYTPTTLQFWNGVLCDSAGVVHARAFPKVLDLATPGFPESFANCFPNWKPTTTLWLDGVLGVVYFNRVSNCYEVLAEDGFAGPATMWGNYQLTNKKMTFPDGYTPVVQLVRDTKRRYDFKNYVEGIYLLALVHNGTGTEMTYEETTEIAMKNRLFVPQVFNFDKIDELWNPLDGYDKGFILKWDMPNGPPLRVSIAKPEYKVTRNTERNTSDKMICRTFLCTGKQGIQAVYTGNPRFKEEFKARVRSVLMEFAKKKDELEKHFWSEYLVGAFVDEFPDYAKDRESPEKLSKMLGWWVGKWPPEWKMVPMHFIFDRGEEVDKQLWEMAEPEN